MNESFLTLLLNIALVLSLICGIGYVIAVWQVPRASWKSKVLAYTIALFSVFLVIWLQLFINKPPDPPDPDPEFTEARCIDTLSGKYNEYDTIKCSTTDFIDGVFQDYIYIGPVSGIGGDSEGEVHYQDGTIYKGEISFTLPNGKGFETLGKNTKKVEYLNGKKIR